MLSEVTHSDALHLTVTHSSSGKDGELYLSTRITTRGKGSKKISYVGIFTFTNSLFCLETDVPDYGGFFQLDDGRVEVTQVIGRFTSSVERSEWIKKHFNYCQTQ